MVNTDKPKSLAADMQRSRDKKRALGLVEFRCWCSPKDREILQTHLALINQTNETIKERAK